MAKLTAALLSEGLRREKLEKLREEIEYIRFREGFRGIERGTVVTRKRVIHGFPHIRRIFTLERGIARNVTKPWLYAEEKIDGFNIRIASLGGSVCAFSRGGFLDAFVTEKAREAGLEGFFREHPDTVLCAEMIGNTPYTSPEKDFDVKMFVFDIDRGDGTYLPCQERYSLLKEHGISGVPVLGRFAAGDTKGLGSLILSLNKGRKEGMVLKSEDRSEAVKYVTPWSDIEDISRNSRLLFDMPIGFYYQRVLRSAFFISDFGLGRDEYAMKLGKAFYDGLERAVKDAAEGKETSEDFEISIRNPAVWDDIRRHMSREVRLEELSRTKENGRLRIRFRKIYKRTSRTLISYAGGKGICD
jgi:putative ATP-dependent DNA ligase